MRCSDGVSGDQWWSQSPESRLALEGFVYWRCTD